MWDDNGNRLYWCQTQREHEIITDYVKAVEAVIAKSSRPDTSVAEFHGYGGVLLSGGGE